MKYKIILMMITVCFLSQSSRAQTGNCQGVDLILTSPDDDINTGVQDYIAEETISSSQIIEGTATVTYQAANQILLTDGAYVDDGAYLLAHLASCNISPTFQALAGGFEVDLLSNPVRDVLNANYYLPEELSLEISLFDMLGREVKQIKSMQKISKGNQSLEVDMSNLASSIYFLRFISDTGNIHTTRIVKTNR